MRKEYSARMAAALDAAIDFLCDPNSPVAVQSEDTVKGSDCHGAGWPGDLPDRLQAFDSPEARWPGDLADRHPSP
jgi:hypothetical protein